MKGESLKRELFLIFGDPVAHSKSPIIHNSSFKKFDYPACYGKYHLKDGSKLREKIISLDVRGCNVTVPHKREAFLACDFVDNFAMSVGVVNTIVHRDGELYGYNTDAPGFLKTIEKFQAKRVLLLGAGGTAKSSAKILRDRGYMVTVANRSKGRLDSFIKEEFEAVTYNRLELREYDLVVNMTSAGLDNESLPAPKKLLIELLKSAKGVVDVIYKETPFLRLARDYELPVRDGSDMLIYQGAIAFGYFLDHRFGFDEVEPIMRRALELQ
jgi:shikimate dehydrogenase